MLAMFYESLSHIEKYITQNINTVCILSWNALVLYPIYFTRIIQGNFAGTRTVIWLSQYQWPIPALTHWGRAKHIWFGKLTIVGSDNGLSPVRRQAIICTNAGILFIGPLRTSFSEILSEIHSFSFKKMHLKISSAKWRPFCVGLNVLRRSLKSKARYTWGYLYNHRNGKHCTAVTAARLHVRKTTSILNTGWSLSCSWNIARRRCSNYIFVIDLTHGFNGLGKDKFKTRRETFNVRDLMLLILEVWRCQTHT